MNQETIILSGTRDELGGVEVGIVNVYRRAEKPEVLSAQLVLPEGEQLIGVGDVIALGGQRIRLTAITPHCTGAYNFHFTLMTAKPPTSFPRSTVRPIPTVAVSDFIKHLRMITPQILQRLAADSTTFEIADWEETSNDSTSTEWNGMQIGPSTHRRAQARFTDTKSEMNVEASIQHDIIRYDPSEIYRQEVSGWWKVGDRSAHMFVRSEGTDVARELWASDLPEPIFALITSYA